MIWHSNAITDVLQELRVDPQSGLSKQEVAARLKEYGRNCLDEAQPISFPHALKQQLRSPFTALLLTVSGITLILDLYKQILQSVNTDWEQSLIVAAITVVSTVISAWRHCRTHAAMAKSHYLAANESKVRRDGAEQTCSTDALVPGDIVLLSAGDVVPADCRLVEAYRLKCDECELTEATTPTEKYADTLFDDITPLAQRTNMLYSGTTITNGSATAVVVATGIRSEMGHRAAYTQSTDYTASVQKQTGKLTVWWNVAVVLLSIVALIVGLIVHEDRSMVVLIAAAIMMAATPRNPDDLWIQLTSDYLQRMMHHRVRIRHPETVQTLANVTVLCAEEETLSISDRPILKEAFISPATHVDLAEGLTTEMMNVRGVPSFWRMAVLNCNGSHPVDQVVLEATAHHFHREDLLLDMPRIGEMTTDDEHRIGVHLAGEQTLILVSGAWRSLLPLCTKGNLDTLADQASAMETSGLQVTAIAYRLVDTAPTVYTAEELEQQLICVGLIGWHMHWHHNLSQTANSLPNLRTILFSDKPVSAAAAVAKRAGFADHPRAITGEALAEFTESEWADAAHEYNVYCGLSAEQKQQLVSALQQQGAIVAVTSGRSDEVELLRSADAGFARGIASTAVIKNAADALLTDDSYNAVMHSLAESRKLNAHKQMVFGYLVLCALIIGSIGVIALFGGIPMTHTALLLAILHLLLMTIAPSGLLWGLTAIAKKN